MSFLLAQQSGLGGGFGRFPLKHSKATEDSTHLVVLEPGQALSSQHKPVLLGSSLHDADVVDGQPAFANDLSEGQMVRSCAHTRQRRDSKTKLRRQGAT